MFGKTEYLSSSDLKDTSDRKSAVADRNRGIQFKVNPPKAGVLNDALFDKFKSLSTGIDGKNASKYEDALAADKKAREESRKAMITSNGFRYSSPGKKATGTGSSYGLFAGVKYDEVKQKNSSDTTKKKEPEPRNILTSPGKKGTYGVPGTTLGKDEFSYKDDKALPEKKKTKEKPEPKNVGPPFKAACKNVEFFDGYPNVPASKIYTIDKQPPPRKPEPPPKKPLIAAPFKPSSPGKRGLQGTLSKFEWKETKVSDEKAKSKKKDDEKKTNVVWKPTAAGHSLPVKSIAYNQTAINSSIIRHG